MNPTERLHFQRTDIGPFSIYATAVQTKTTATAQAEFVAAVVVQRHRQASARPEIILYDEALFEGPTFADPAEAIEAALSSGRLAVTTERTLDTRGLDHR